jgi:hydrogenase maturation protease
VSALLIGIGNASRGDDAAGLAVAAKVARAAPPGVVVLSLSGEPAELLDAWQGSERVLLVDSCSGGGPAGRMRRFEAGAGPLPAALLRASTHSLGVAEAVELARALKRLPKQLTVYCIEGRSFEPRALSADVAAAVDRLAAELLLELGGSAAADSKTRGGSHASLA